jgi:hypothetical protein
MPVWTLALLSFAQSPPVEAEPANPTARETYVGCSLLVRDVNLADTRPEGERGYSRWFDASGCFWVAVGALIEHTGDPASGAGSNRSPAFCPPESLNLSVHDVRPLAAAYLAYFERHAAEVADRPARPVFLEAMLEKWPCP